MTPVVEFNGVGFSYSHGSVLHDINFQIYQDEFFGLIGPNAGGKSTLLKLMLGILNPDRGRISILGKPPLKVRSRIGYVPQFPTYRRDFPICLADVVIMGRLGITSMVGRYSNKDREYVRGVLQALELDNIADRQVAALSGGQMQRMLIARALACEPEILILDEPTANIDIKAEENIFALLKKYQEHMTIIVVSHDIGFISGYVDRVGCLNRTLVCHETGAISGKTIEELYGAPVRMIDHAHTL